MELLGLAYSPWTEKARWALDVRRVPYAFRPYQPLLGEPALRLALRRLRGRVSVPVLTTDDGQILEESEAIARFADAHGEARRRARPGGDDGPRLFPEEHEAAVARFSALSERALDAGRALSLRRMLADDEALAEMVPGPIRRATGALAARIGGLGVARTLRKYGGHQRDDDAHRRTLTDALDALRSALAEANEGEPRTLCGALTYADLAMAQVLVFVDPPASGLKLGNASRRSFSDPGLRERYGDLVAWRDELYRVYRQAR